MTHDGSRGPRRSPRQAIAIVERALPENWPAELRRTVLLDLIGAAVALNGTTIFFAPQEDTGTTATYAALPAGVNALPGAAGAPDGVTRALADEMRSREFERFLLIVADTLGVETRVLATALSAAGTTGVAAGRAGWSGLYLVGLSADAGTEERLHWMRALERPGSVAPPPGPVAWVERVPVLADMSTMTELDGVLRERAGLLPRTVRRLSDHRDAAPRNNEE